MAVLDFAWPAFGAYVETNGKMKYLELVKPAQKPGDVVQRERRREELVHRFTGFRAMHVIWSDLDTPRADGAARAQPPVARRGLSKLI